MAKSPEESAVLTREQLETIDRLEREINKELVKYSGSRYHRMWFQEQEYRDLPRKAFKELRQRFVDAGWEDLKTMDVCGKRVVTLYSRKRPTIQTSDGEFGG